MLVARISLGIILSSLIYSFLRLLITQPKTILYMDQIALTLNLIMLNLVIALISYTRFEVVFLMIPVTMLILSLGYLRLISIPSRNKPLAEGVDMIVHYIAIQFWIDIFNYFKSIYLSIANAFIEFYSIALSVIMETWEQIVEMFMMFFEAIQTGWNGMYDLIYSLVTLNGSISEDIAPPILISKI